VPGRIGVLHGRAPRHRGDLTTLLDRATGAITSVTTLIYLGVAVVLSLLAAISFVGVVIDIGTIITTHDISNGVIQALHALLVTIIIIELLDTVVVYARTHRFLIQPILVAGITAMVRRILLVGVEATSPVDTGVTVASILVLAIAIVLVNKVGH
jgi:uncharacterized membrane protein (DUF373 family)